MPLLRSTMPLRSMLQLSLTLPRLTMSCAARPFGRSTRRHFAPSSTCRLRWSCRQPGFARPGNPPSCSWPPTYPACSRRTTRARTCRLRSDSSKPQGPTQPASRYLSAWSLRHFASYPQDPMCRQKPLWRQLRRWRFPRSRLYRRSPQAPSTARMHSTAPR